MMQETWGVFIFFITRITLILLFFMFWLNMCSKTTICCCFISTNCTWILYTNMNSFIMFCQITWCCCLITAQFTRIFVLFVELTCLFLFEWLPNSLWHMLHLYFIPLWMWLMCVVKRFFWENCLPQSWQLSFTILWIPSSWAFK